MIVLSIEDKSCYYRCRQQFAVSLMGNHDLSIQEKIEKFNVWLAKFGAKIDKTARDQDSTIVTDWIGVSLKIDKIVFDSLKHLVVFKLKFSNKG